MSGWTYFRLSDRCFGQFIFDISDYLSLCLDALRKAIELGLDSSEILQHWANLVACTVRHWMLVIVGDCPFSLDRLAFSGNLALDSLGASLQVGEVCFLTAENGVDLLGAPFNTR